MISCNGEINKPKYSHGVGFVVIRETCFLDPTNDPWIVDISYPVPQSEFGDSINIDGINYLHAVRSFDLPDSMKIEGLAIDFDFLSNGKKATLSGCNADSSSIFNLKEVDFKQGGVIQ